MALAISGFSRVRRSSRRIRSNQLPDRWASMPWSATRSSTFQLRSPREHQSLRLLGRAPARVSKSDVKNAYLPRASRMSASSAPPSVSRPSRAAAAVSRSPDISGAARQPDPQVAGRRSIGAVERLAVGRRRHRVADGVEQVAPQRQRRRPAARRSACGRTASTSASASR